MNTFVTHPWIAEAENSVYLIDGDKVFIPKAEDNNKTLIIKKKEEGSDNITNTQQERILKSWKEREEREFKLLGQIYSENFLKRLLRLVEMFTSIATCSSRPLSMV